MGCQSSAEGLQDAESSHRGTNRGPDGTDRHHIGTDRGAIWCQRGLT